MTRVAASTALLLLAVGAALLQGFRLDTLLALNALAGGVLLWALARAAPARAASRGSAPGCIVLALGAWLLLSAWLSPAGGTPFLAATQQLPLVLAFLAAALFAPSSAQWRRFVQLMAVFGAVLAAASVLEPLYRVRPGFGATFVQRNSLAGYLLLVIFLALPLLDAALASAERRRLRVALAAVPIFVCAFVVFLSTSRAALAALVVAFAGFLVSADPAVRERAGKFALALLLWAFLLANQSIEGGAIAALGSLRYVSLDGVDDPAALVHLDPEQASKVESANERTLIWRGAAALLPSVPWHGFGPGSFRHVYPAVGLAGDRSDRLYAHNDYLQSYIELGLPGLGLVALLGVVVVLRWVQARRAGAVGDGGSAERDGLLWGMAALAGHSVFTYHFYVPATLVLLGVVLARFERATQAQGPRPARGQGRAARVFLAAAALLPAVLLGPGVLMSRYHASGAEALAGGRLGEAEAAFDAAARWYPNGQTEVARAMLYLAAHDASEDRARRRDLLATARHHRDVADATLPRSPLVPYLDLLFAARDGEPGQRAAAAYERAIRRDPRYYPARLEMARQLLDRGLAERARRVLEEGLALPFPRRADVIEYLVLLRQLRLFAHDEAGAASAETAISRMQRILAEQ
ncbi:MAG: O-antigen ligase family protein [Gammaproteobacteria bacterium]